MDGLIDYSRQREFDNTLHNIQPRQLNYIIGCGGVGFWLGIILAMQGQEHFVLVDGQSIEKSNLNRLPVPPTWLGTNKAIALRRVMRHLRPVTAIHTVTEHIEESTFEMITNEERLVAGARTLHKVVWDCTDDARIQKKLYKAIQQVERMQYRKIGYEGFQVGSYKEYDVWLPSDYAPGYRTSNACAATSALAAVLGIVTQGLNITHDVEINIKEMCISKQVTRPPVSKDAPVGRMLQVNSDGSVLVRYEASSSEARRAIIEENGRITPPPLPRLADQILGENFL